MSNVFPAWMRPHTVTLVHPYWEDTGRGSSAPRYDHRATRTTLPGCNVQPGGSTEEATPERNTTEVAYTVIVFRTDLDIRPTDGVEFGGTLYAVDGKPRVHRGTPGRLLDHTQIDLVAWE